MEFYGNYCRNYFQKFYFTFLGKLWDPNPCQKFLDPPLKIMPNEELMERCTGLMVSALTLDLEKISVHTYVPVCLRQTVYSTGHQVVWSLQENSTPDVVI